MTFSQKPPDRKVADKNNILMSFIRYLDSGKLSGHGKIMLLSVLVGVAGGLGAIVFYTLLDAAKALFLGVGAGYYPAGPGGEPSLFGLLDSTVPLRRWALLIIPALGGLVSGWIVFKFAPEAEGHGTDAAIEAYHYRRGPTRARVPLIKIIASAITIGSGGSGGREGPIAQIGSGFGSMISSWLRLNERERRILMCAGVASGVGSIFHAPMAGALFAAEVLYRDLDMEYEVLVPSFISSIIGYAVFASFFGWESLFVTPEFTFHNPLQLFPYTLLAVAAALGAYIYIKVFYGVRGLFHRSRIPQMLRPAVGGLAVGIMGFILPQSLATGYGVIQSAMCVGTDLESQFGYISILLLLAVFAGKIFTTAFAIGSGGSGGVFGPAIVIGGALGGAVGQIAWRLMPALDIQPGAFVLVGMAAFFGAAAKTPISTIIIVSEMTGNYSLLVPSMWACIIAYVLLRNHALYEKQLPSRFDAPVHRGNMIKGVLNGISVKEAIGMINPGVTRAVMENTPVMDLLAGLTEHPDTGFPVLDKDHNLRGVVLARDLRSAMLPGNMGDILIAGDLAVPAATVSESSSLLNALQEMTKFDHDMVVVVSKDNPNLIAGTLTHADILSVYHVEASVSAGL